MQEKLYRSLRIPAIVAAGFAVAGADQTSLGPTVGNVLITKHIAGGNLGLSNRSAVKTVQAVDLRVSGDDPVYTVTGQIFCKNGARLVEAQAVIGNVVLNNGQPFAMVRYGESAKLKTIAGRADADVAIPVRLSVVRRDTGSLVELRFSPARTFNDKLKSFTGSGGSAVTYLREDQAFEMPVNVNLIGWCKMPANANSVLAGKTYAGMATRSVPVSVLYAGDPRIVDGRGVRAAAGQQVKAKEEPAPAPQKISAPQPPRRED